MKNEQEFNEMMNKDDDLRYRDIISKPSRSFKDMQKQFEQQKAMVAQMNAHKFRKNDKKAKERVERALKDFQFFVHTYLRHYTIDENTGKEIPLGWFHKEAVEKLMNDHWEFMGLFEWSRSFAKTTLSMMIIIWLVVRGDIKNLIYVSKSKDFSVTQLMNIQAEFEANELLISDFGPFKEGSPVWRVDHFVIPKFDCSISALGRGQSPRGIKYKMYRPDFIMIDDIDDDENSRNPRRVRQLVSWFRSELMNTVGTKYKVLMIGNKFSNESLISWYADNIPGLYHSKVNAINEDGNSNWPERYTIEYLLRRREVIGRIAFEREFMNNPITEGLLFKEENMHVRSMDKNYDVVVCYIDPSWTDKSDYKSAVMIAKKNEEFHILDVFCRQCTMKTMVDWCFNWYLRNYIHFPIKFYMESNFAQNILADEFTQAEKEYGVTLPLILDKKKQTEKYARIEAITPYFERNLVYWNEDLEGVPDYNEGISQLLGYEKSTTNHDDFPDCLEGAITKINITARSENTDPIIEIMDNNWEW